MSAKAGIDEAEGKALIIYGVGNPVALLQHLKASSAGRSLTLDREQKLATIGTLFSEFEVRDGKVRVQFGVKADGQPLKLLDAYAADKSKQVSQSLTLLVTLTGVINDKAEIEDFSLDGEVHDLPRLSLNKLGGFQETTRELLDALPTGGVISDAMKQTLGTKIGYALQAASRLGVGFLGEAMRSSSVFNIDLRPKDSSTTIALTVGNSALDIRAADIFRTFGHNYPKGEAGAEIALEGADHDTLDIKSVGLRTDPNEKLVVTFDTGEPRLFRIDADGKRTEVEDVFAQLVTGLPFVVGMLQGNQF